ncbi:MAG: M23 family metallopeptidase [Alphaproteobacteria bacterium]|nr:M23 family metallopeptidase [Alphaproteobacteria bacterium]
MRTGRLIGLLAVLSLLAACARELAAPVEYRITPLLERVLNEAETTPINPANMPANVYVVQRGDTLPRVAQRFGLETIRLASANNLQPPYNLKPGQRLSLPPLAVDRDIAVLALAPPPEPRPAASDPTRSERPRSAQTETPVAAGSSSPRAPAPSAGAPPPVSPPREGRLASTAPAWPAQSSPPLPSAPATAPLRNTTPVAPPPRSGAKFAWPVEGPVIATFGPQGGGRANDGIDIRAAMGTPILAADAGVVLYVGNEVRGFGNLLLLRHADGLVTAYAHADEIVVKKGDQVGKGQVVGRVGHSGLANEPKLHFEVRKGTEPLDPIGQLVPRERRLAQG